MTTKTALVAHAEHGASSSDRWMNCAGSLRLSRGVPATTSSYAEEGTVAHELGATCLTHERDTVEFIDRQILGHVVDDEMAEHIQTYIDHVRSEIEPGDVVMIEQKFTLERLGPPVPMFGTCDAAIYKPRQRLLKIKDLKYGAGVAVEAVANPQMRYYGLGGMLSLPDDMPVTAVETTIFQPRAPHRAGPVRSETLSAFELVEWSGDLLEAVSRTLKVDAPLVAGDWCRFCPAVGFCPALREAAFVSAQHSFSVIEDEPVLTVPPSAEHLTSAQLGRVLDAADLIDLWVSAARAEAFDRLGQGEPVPGWKLVPKRAQRSWDGSEDDVVAELQVQFGLHPADIYSQKLRSPAQIEKLLPKAERPALADLYSKASSGVTLAPDTDHRTPLTTRAAGVFAVLEDENA
jgi:hypothetical protein